MAQINPSSLRDWNNGDTIDEAAYEQERQILYTAINDNYARLIKQYFVRNADGSTKATQALDTAINYINFRDTASIQIALDNVTSTLTFTLINGSVTTNSLADSSVTTIKIEDLAVSTAKIANLAVTNAKVADNAITTTKIVDANVTTAKLADLNVTTSKISDNAITTAKIVDSNVTTNKIVDNAITTAKIVDGNITTAKIANDSVVTAKIADGNVTNAKIASGTITSDKLVTGTLDNRYYTESEIDTTLTNYYTKTNMQTSGQALVHWNNLTNVPAMADPSWKPPVATVSALPTTGNTNGDLRIVLDVDTVYTWDAPTASWKVIGATGNGITSHSTLNNLTNDDHPQYLRTDGTRTFTGNQNFNKYQALNLVTHNSATAPTSPVEGQLWYDTTLQQMKVYKGAVKGWVDVSGQGALIRDKEFTATAGQTVFSVADVGTYVPSTNAISVFVNGSLLRENQYTETSTTVVTLNTGATAGQIVYIKWFENDPALLADFAKKDGTLQSNLNADLLDGQHASAFVQKTGDTMTGVLNVIAGTVTAPAIAPSGDSNTGIFFPAADTVAIGEGGTEVLRINSAGNVGIGTTNPTNKLTVVGSANIASDGFGPASFVVDGSIYGNIITGAYAEITDIAVPTSLSVWGTATVQTPTATNHAATKGYVDSAGIGSVISLFQFNVSTTNTTSGNTYITGSFGASNYFDDCPFLWQSVFSGTKTVYFEAILQGNGSTTAYAALKSSTGTLYGQISKTGTGWTRVRSSAITIPNNTTVFPSLWSSNGNQVYAHTFRLIII